MKSMFDTNLLRSTLEAIYKATVKNPADDKQLAKFVKDADGMLQVAAFVDAASVTGVFQDFYANTKLDTAGRGRLVAALAASDNVTVRTFLAAKLQRAIKASEVYDAPMPPKLEVLEIYRSPAAASGHERAGRITVLSGLGARGKGADIFEVPAHIAVVPQHRSLDPKHGGGSRGGVAAYGRAKVLEATKKQPQEVRDQAIAAMDSFQTKLEAAKNPLPPGFGDLVSTGVDDPTVFPGAIFDMPLVPPPDLRITAQTSEEALMASQPSRMRYGQDMLAAGLERLAAQASSLYGEPSIASPLVISMPMLNTGTAALLTEAEAGWVYGNVARTFLDKNPGYEILFTPYEPVRASEFAANRDAFIGGLRAIDAPPPKVQAEDVKSPAQLLALAAEGARAVLKAGGPSINVGDDATLVAEMAKVKAAMLGALAPGEAADRYVGGAAVNKSSGYALSEAFWQAHRMAELPAKAQHYTGGGKATDKDGLATPTVASLSALLDSEALMFEVRESLRREMGGDDTTIIVPQARLTELIAIATARTLQQSRHDYVNESQTRLTNEIAGADARVKAALSVFGPTHRTLVDLIQEAQKRLTTAIEQGKSLEASVRDFKADIKRFSADNTLLGDEAKRARADLKAKINELAIAQQQLAAAQASARSSASSYSRATSSYSG